MKAGHGLDNLLAVDYRHLHPVKPCRHHDGTFDSYGQMQKIKSEYEEA